jgi:mRNA interferase MazF
MSLQKGDIVLVSFPFTDLSATKLRPAVVLWVDKAGNDVTVCFISSQNLANISSEEFIINSTDPEFLETGLKSASKIRVSRLATLEKSFITRRIGKLGTILLTQLNTCLKNTFQI